MLRARRVVLATGARDELPDIPDTLLPDTLLPDAPDTRLPDTLLPDARLQNSFDPSRSRKRAREIPRSVADPTTRSTEFCRPVRDALEDAE